MRRLTTSTRVTRNSCAVRRIIGRCALAAVGAGFYAISASAFGAELGTGPFSSSTSTYPTAPQRHKTAPVQQFSPSDAKLDHLAQHARAIDRLYVELMTWTAPGCGFAANSAAARHAC
jgi:hypothetical protein